MDRGLVQVYTGNGKGKTTAATGLVVRALGQDLQVLLVRFLKPQTPVSGEIVFLEKAAGLKVLTSGVGVIHGSVDPQQVADSVHQTFSRAREEVLSGRYDLVVLDEVNNAVYRGALPLDALTALLRERPPGVEMVLTGRHAHPKILKCADLVTSMEDVRHPARTGVTARRGIEF